MADSAGHLSPSPRFFAAKQPHYFVMLTNMPCVFPNNFIFHPLVSVVSVESLRNHADKTDEEAMKYLCDSWLPAVRRLVYYISKCHPYFLAFVVSGSCDIEQQTSSFPSRSSDIFIYIHHGSFFTDTVQDACNELQSKLSTSEI